MLRELTNAVEALAAHDALVLAIEDLHWSDPSTLDWISNVAPRMDRAKLLVIATLRPASGDEADGPLALLRDGLRARRLAREIALTGLATDAVAEYVARTFRRLPAEDQPLSGWRSVCITTPGAIRCSWRPCSINLSSGGW